MKLPRLRLLPREGPITTAEKTSIALPTEMVEIVRGAVATGEYASSSEVIRDALRDWKSKRNLRQKGIVELRQISVKLRCRAPTWVDAFGRAR